MSDMTKLPLIFIQRGTAYIYYQSKLFHCYNIPKPHASLSPLKVSIYSFYVIHFPVD